MPGYSTPWDQAELAEGVPDTGAQMERFARAVREAVEGPEFPKAGFVRRLLLYVIGLQRGWLELAKQLSVRDEKVVAQEMRLIERMLTSEDEAGRERAARRFGWLFCASLARDQALVKTSEGSEAPGLIASVVFEALDTALLEAGDLLHEMLADRHLRHRAIQALERLGPAAAPFVPDLLEHLEQGRRFDGQAVLGAVAQSDPALAEELVARLRSGSEEVRLAVAGALETAGPAVGEPVVDEALGLLRELVRTNASWYARAMASLGRDREDVLEEMLSLAAPKPPQIQTVRHGKFEMSYDQVMYDRGAAIDGLKYFTKFPERAVPALAEAVETFEEPDPDWMDKGDHERVTTSLQAFGPAAEIAVPALARHLRKSDGEVDWDVVRRLGEMGPAAEKALPALRDLEKNQHPLMYSDGVEPFDPPDKDADPVLWAIWRIAEA